MTDTEKEAWMPPTDAASIGNWHGAFVIYHSSPRSRYIIWERKEKLSASLWKSVWKLTALEDHCAFPSLSMLTSPASPPFAFSWSCMGFRLGRLDLDSIHCGSVQIRSCINPPLPSPSPSPRSSLPTPPCLLWMGFVAGGGRLTCQTQACRVESLQTEVCLGESQAFQDLGCSSQGLTCMYEFIGDTGTRQESSGVLYKASICVVFRPWMEIHWKTCQCLF